MLFSTLSLVYTTSRDKHKSLSLSHTLPHPSSALLCRGNKLCQPIRNRRTPFDVTPGTLPFRDLVSYPAINKVAPYERLSVIAGHLLQRLSASSDDSLPNEPSPITQTRSSSSSSQNPKTPSMSSQPNHPALLIPGPIEFDDAVLQSMSHYR